MTGYDIVREDFPNSTNKEILKMMIFEGDCPCFYGLDETGCFDGLGCDTCITKALEKEYPE